MDNPLQLLQDWLTYVNVQLLGLKPFRIDPIRVPLLVAGCAALVWAALSSNSNVHITRLCDWGRARSCRRMTGVVAVLLVVGLTYLSLRQYYDFTAESYDLGIYSSVLWHTAHGNWFYDALRNDHFLGDHFGPILLAFAPLYLVKASPVWLLLVQTIALGLGALAVGMLTARLTRNATLVSVALLLYVANPYLHTLAALDFHLIALAIPVFLWMLYCLETARHAWALVLGGVALLVEESLAPGVVSIGVYLMVFRRECRWIGVTLAATAALWFLLVVAVFLPYHGNGALTHWHRFDNLGPDFKTAVFNLVTNPWLVFHEGLVTHYKFFYLVRLLLAVGFLPLLAWREATLMVPPALMMLLSSEAGLFKLGYHYSAAVLPFVLYSTIHGLAKLAELRGESPLGWMQRERVAFCLVMAVLVLNIYEVREYRLNDADHGHTVAINTVLESVPRDASVRAEVNLVARLSTRSHVAPIEDSVEQNFAWWTPEYFVLDFRTIEDNAGLDRSRRALVAHLMEDDRYGLVSGYDGVLALKARDPSERASRL